MEPAAYMTKEGPIYKKHQTRPIEADIPLYALREITDEEILALWVKKNNLNGAKDILDFARELLRMASDK
jgi:hypothetical protein